MKDERSNEISEISNFKTNTHKKRYTEKRLHNLFNHIFFAHTKYLGRTVFCTLKNNLTKKVAATILLYSINVDFCV